MTNKGIILAGGLGTRLYKYTNGLYPKILLNLGNSIFLDNLIEFWFNVQEVEELIIVLSENDHIYKIQEYLKIFYNDKNITLLKYDKVNGTFNTLFYVLNMRNDLLKSNLIISWSDIIPTEKLNILEYSGIKIFTDKISRHRCNICNLGIITNKPDLTGNIPGFYNINGLNITDWINFKNSYEKIKPEIDITDYLITCSNIIQEKIDLLDIGDIEKYENVLKTQDIKQRWFNNIIFNTDNVIKSSNSDYGLSVIKSEIEFYKKIQGTEAENIFPKIYDLSNNSINMENLCTNGYVTVNEFLESNPNQEDKLLEDYKKNIKTLHNINHTLTNFNTDIYKEYIQVPIERYSKINYFIPNIDILNINDKDIYINYDFYETMDKLLKYFSNKEFNIALIHGDTNSTNTLYNQSTNKIALIDPRGKFGNTLYYGDTNYDLAKFVYGITGYDKFNLDKYFNFNFSNNFLDLKKIKIDLPELNLLDNLNISNDIKILVGLIWLKLPFYIKNNPNKIIASYYIGMYLINKYL